LKQRLGSSKLKVESSKRIHEEILLETNPVTLKARAYPKRIFMGKFVSLPPEICEGMAAYGPPMEIPADKPNKDFKILYAVGDK